MEKRYLIIGAGFSGAVLAEQLSKRANTSIVVLDERDHLGGNCYTVTDPLTGIMEHKYGPHIFHTDNKRVWDYISEFCSMSPYINRIKAISKGDVYSFPLNLHTINQFFKLNLSPEGAKTFLNSITDKSIVDPKNFEEIALKTIGKELYMAFFYFYTKKQWGQYPVDLPASVFNRLPVRFTYNDNYYNHQYQGIPEEGYTPIFDKLLKHSRIEVRLNCKFTHSFSIKKFDHVFFTGPIDFFFNYKYGRLSYRTVFFEKEYAVGDFQGNAVINYTDDSEEFTRIHEHKHFTPWKKFQKTVFFREFSKETGENDIPFYPKRLSEDMEKLKLYQNESAKVKQITFLGRLGTYRYLDMHDVINEALDIAKRVT